VKYFSGACYKGYSSLEEALSEWDIAIAGGHIGPRTPRRVRRCDALQPSTPSRDPVIQPSTPSRDPVSTPSRGSSTLVGPSNTSRGLSSMSAQPASQNSTCTTPTRSRRAPDMTSPPSTPVRPASRNSGSTLSPSSPSSLSNFTHGPPSSRGSAARIASITNALEGLNVDAYYAVIQGRKPGVYTSRYVSRTSHFLFVAYI
jgi:hypothetical protein